MITRSVIHVISDTNKKYFQCSPATNLCYINIRMISFFNHWRIRNQHPDGYIFLTFSHFLQDNYKIQFRQSGFVYFDLPLHRFQIHQICKLVHSLLWKPSDDQNLFYSLSEKESHYSTVQHYL